MEIYTRLGDIAIFWNAIQHFYPYPLLIKPSWEIVLYSCLDRAFRNNTLTDFQQMLELMVAALHDAHGYVEIELPNNFIPI